MLSSAVVVGVVVEVVVAAAAAVAEAVVAAAVELGSAVCGSSIRYIPRSGNHKGHTHKNKLKHCCIHLKGCRIHWIPCFL